MSKICFMAKIASVMITIFKMSCNFIAWSISYLITKSLASVELIFIV